MHASRKKKKKKHSIAAYIFQLRGRVERVVCPGAEGWCTNLEGGFDLVDVEERGRRGN